MFGIPLFYALFILKVFIKLKWLLKIYLLGVLANYRLSFSWAFFQLINKILYCINQKLHRVNNFCQNGELISKRSFKLFQGIEEHRPNVVFITHGESSGTTCQPLEGIGELCHKWAFFFSRVRLTDLNLSVFFLCVWIVYCILKIKNECGQLEIDLLTILHKIGLIVGDVSLSKMRSAESACTKPLFRSADQ